jgi:hypothetical protein
MHDFLSPVRHNDLKPGEFATSHFSRHPGKSRGPEVLQIPGFRLEFIRLRRAGMTENDIT